MKTLLVAINSKYIHSNLAVYSLKSYCSEVEMDIEIDEFTINQYANFICSKIYKKKPDIVAFSCYIWNIEMIYEIAIDLKKVMPNLHIWLGGPEVSYDSLQILAQHPYIKGIMIGEGEETFQELMTTYSVHGLDSEFQQIKGISYHNQKELIKSTNPRLPINMDSVSFIYSNIDISKFDNKIIYYESSRGCPFGCSYCLSSVEKSVRFRNIELVKKELKYFLDHKVKQVKFVDRTFNCNRMRSIELLQFIRDNDNGITNFHFEIAADLLSNEEIQIMHTMRAGLIQLEIGVQSTNIDTIEEIDRTMDFNKVSTIVEQINKGKNVHQHLDLIAGLPYEDMESFKQSFNDVYQLMPEQLQLGFLKVLKGSYMHFKASEYGILYTEKAPYEVLSTNWLTYDEILSLKNIEEVVELYYNSGQYKNTIKLLETMFASPFELYKSLAAYYEENGLFEIQHSRISRYQILLSFIKTVVQDSLEIFEQILVFDLYLRENLKTRPEFALDISKHKDGMRKLYQCCATSKSMHIEPFSIDVEKVCNLNLQKQSLKETLDLDLDFAATFIMFNYDERNSLNYEAKVYRIIH